MPNILTELKRRNVFRVAVAYVIVTWVIAQALDLAADSFGAPEWVMKVILALLIAGLPVAVIFAWAFELTPEGVKKTEDVPVTESITPRTGQKLNRITMAALVLLLAFVAWDKLGPTGESTDITLADKSVAVLPFADLSEGQDQEWFSDGLTEEILNALARLPELKVTARTSSFEFKNTNTDISEIAAKLGVAHVVEGSVRRIGENLRVTAQLIRAADGFHLWSDTYDRNTDDLFDVQQSVAENIAATLDVILDEEKRDLMFTTGTRNVEAFEAYLKGRVLYIKAHLRNAVDPATLAQANVHLERALQLDPGFFRAAITHSDRYSHYLIEGPSSIVGNSNELDVETAYARLRQDLEIAVNNAPDAKSRIVAEINQQFFAPTWHRLPALIAQLKELVHEDAKFPPTSLWINEILLMAGETDMVLAAAEIRVQADSLNQAAWVNIIDVEMARGNYEAVESTLAEARSMLGDTLRFRENEIALALQLGDSQTAIAAMRKDPEAFNDTRYFAALTAVLEGDMALAIEISNEMEASSEWPDWNLVIVYSVMDDPERHRNLIGRLDALKVGPAVMGIIWATNFGGHWTDIDAAPNFRARLEEAGIDPSPARNAP